VKPLRVKDTSRPDDTPIDSLSAGESEVLSEGVFKRMIALERMRTERSKEPFHLPCCQPAGKPM